MNNDRQTGYQAAYEKAAYYILPNAGLLMVHGADRGDFIQRQTTNDVRLLTGETALVTVLTSPAARIIDVLHLFDGSLLETSIPGERETIGVITLPDRHLRTAQFLQNRIFIMDRVSVDDISAQYVQFNLIGPESRSVLEEIGINPPDEPGQISAVDCNGDVTLAMRADGNLYRGWLLVVPVNQQYSVQSGLDGMGVSQMNTDGYHIFRIEQGLPSHGNELTEDFTPLEIGLRDEISNDKGCYTGQEVIARQLTYDKVTRNLVGLRLKGLAPSGTRLYVEDKLVGVITSTIESPRFGLIALAVVKRPYNTVGAVLKVLAGRNSSLNVSNSAIVSPLPF